MKKITAIILTILFFIFTGCISTENITPSNSVEDHSDMNRIDEQSWISIDSYDLYQDEGSLYIKVNITPGKYGAYSVFLSGMGYLSGGAFSAETDFVLTQINKSEFEKVDSIAIWFRKIDSIIKEMPERIFISQDDVNWNDVPPIEDSLKNNHLNISEIENIQLETKEEFIARRPWLLHDSIIIKNSEWDPGNPWDSRFSIEENFQKDFVLNEDFPGKWKSYGELYNVPLSLNDLNSQNLFKLWESRGEILIEDDADRAVLILNNDGSAHGDFGNLWTDGWLISEADKKISHLFLRDDSETGKTLLFLEIKNGDFNRGKAPDYLVFNKE